MMTTEICLGPIPLLLLTTFDKQIFNNISTEGVTSRSENKTSTIQKHCPTSKIFTKMKDEYDDVSRKKITDSRKFENHLI